MARIIVEFDERSNGMAELVRSEIEELLTDLYVENEDISDLKVNVEPEIIEN